MNFQSNLLRTVLASYAALGLFFGTLAHAQKIQGTPQPPTATQTAPTTPADAAFEAAKRAFESLPDADRIAIQDGLIWTGDYNGIAAGKFGRATRDAIVAFATKNKLPADGTLDAKGRVILAAAAKQAKEAVHFEVRTDDKTGIRIGLPLKLLTKTKPSLSGTRYSSADDSFSVETLTSETSLQDAYAALIADVPGHKLTYKASRPDFFVVTGETGPKAFYTRMAPGESGGHAVLKGFTITYPLADKTRLNPIVIAISNAFIAFPDATASAAPALNQGGAPVSATPAPASDANGSKPLLTASGAIIAPGLVLTSLPKTCTDPTIHQKKTKIMKQGEDGLSLLSFTEAATATFPIRATDPADSSQIIVLSFTSKANGGAVNTSDDLIGASGDLHKLETGGWRLSAPVQSPVAGAAVLDHTGTLIGLVPLDAKPAKLIAGLLPQMNREIISASKIAAFLAEAKPKSVEHTDLHTTGEIVAMSGMAMVPISCTH